MFERARLWSLHIKKTFHRETPNSPQLTSKIKYTSASWGFFLHSLQRKQNSRPSRLLLCFFLSWCASEKKRQNFNDKLALCMNKTAQNFKTAPKTKKPIGLMPLTNKTHLFPIPLERVFSSPIDPPNYFEQY